MSDTVISVHNLGKRYKIGGQQPYRTLREKLDDKAMAPFRVARHLVTRNGNGTKPRNSKSDLIWALKDVSFDVRRGEVVGIIGRNGAGKSTLLKILSRITEPTEGYADINGRIASLLEVGTGFHPELTGRENISLNGSILGMRRTEIQSKFDEIVAFAEIEKFIDTPVKHYSSGMYVRLAFAVAAHLDPEILLVDEVLAVGDAAFQKKCLGKIGEVAHGGRTILFVSHNMTALESICSTAILLGDGRVVAEGKPRHVIESYLGTIGTNEIHLKTSKLLRWIGIGNRSALSELRSSDDLNLLLDFESASEEIRSLHVDVAIFNERAESVIHTKSKFVSLGWTIPTHSRFTVQYKINSPKLAPGSYYLTVYAYNEDGELVWIEGIDGFHVSAKAYFGISEYYDGVRSAIFPEYSVEVRSAE